MSVWFTSPLDQMICAQVHSNHLTAVYAVENHPLRTEIVIIVTKLLVADPPHLLKLHPRNMIPLPGLCQALQELNTFWA